MDNNILLKFLERNYYRGQINGRLNVLKNYLQKQFFNSPQSQTSTEDSEWLKSLGEDFFKNFTTLNVYQVLSKLEKDIKLLQTLTIYVPFEMPDGEKDKLGLWLRGNFKKDLIFEIKLDPALIGGTALSWKGIYRDYSLRAKIDQNHEAILSSLKTLST
ncbi:MAG: hypothetical protein Q7R49_03210 [Candidatus Daviesbacteria bacterium]|nr:hypothetical protein [Candidatus Daviesbacteria bacterium]